MWVENERAQSRRYRELQTKKEQTRTLHEYREECATRKFKGCATRLRGVDKL